MSAFARHRIRAEKSMALLGNGGRSVSFDMMAQDMPGGDQQ